jgi:hypothetical protein
VFGHVPSLQERERLTKSLAIEDTNIVIIEEIARLTEPDVGDEA